MSATKSWTINCDECGEAGNTDLGCTTAAEARREARDWSGFIRRKGRDLCEICADETPGADDA